MQGSPSVEITRFACVPRKRSRLCRRATRIPSQNNNPNSGATSVSRFPHKTCHRSSIMHHEFQRAVAGALASYARFPEQCAESWSSAGHDAHQDGRLRGRGARSFPQGGDGGSCGICAGRTWFQQRGADQLVLLSTQLASSSNLANTRSHSQIKGQPKSAWKAGPTNSAHFASVVGLYWYIESSGQQSRRPHSAESIQPCVKIAKNLP